MFIYDRNKYFRAFMNKLGFARPTNLTLQDSRIVEYPWVMRNLPSKGKILDVGPTGSQLPLMLLALGNEVWTIDIRKYEYQNVSENLHCIKGDIRKTGLPFAFFDIVVAVSTIEHIGLGRYGDSIDALGDLNAVGEIKRILKPEGTLLMTVPFGRAITTVNNRVYDKVLLTNLLRDFEIEIIQYFARSGSFWRESSIEKKESVNSASNAEAIACIKASKPRTRGSDA